MADLHNYPAEIGVLGAILYENSNYEFVSETLKPDDFFTITHQEIFTEVTRKIRLGEVADGSTLFNWAKANLDEQGGAQYLITLIDNAAFGPEIRDYAGSIKENSTRRKLTEILKGAEQKTAGASKPEEVMDEVERSLREMQVNIGTKWAWHASDKINVQDVMRQYNIKDRIPTGWKSLNDKFYGWPRGNPTVIAGRPGMGKSLFGVDICRRIAEQGVGVGYFSLEMKRDDLWLRMACDVAFSRKLECGDYNTPNHSDVRQGKASPEHLWAVEDALKRIKRLPIQIDDRSSLTPSEIHRWTRRLSRYYEKRNLELGAIIIDHVHIMKAENERGGNKVSETTDISSALLEVAKEMNIAVIELCQLNRGVEDRQVKRPMLRDLRESGAIEQDAEMVIGLHRPAYYLEREQHDGKQLTDDELAKLASEKFLLEVDILKNRTGPVGRIDMLCVAGGNVVADPERVLTDERRRVA